MSLVIGDNFSFQGAKPLDGRLKYDTVAAMKAVADATMYDGCLAYCSATDKTYQWKSTNSVDSTLGRWREFSSGGGGGAGSDTTAYHTSDTEETTLADSDKFPFYDASASAARHSTWSNLKAKLKSYFDTVYDLNKNDIPMYGTSSTGASTTAKTASVSRGTFTLVTGAKVSIKFTNTNTASAPTLNVGSTGAKNIKYIASDGTVTTPTTWWAAGEVVTFVYDGTQWLMMPTISMMPSLPVVGTINRSDILSTTEKVVGCSIDGRPIYQRTFSGTLINTSSAGTGTFTYISTGASINNYITIEGVVRNSANNNDIILSTADTQAMIRLLGGTNFTSDTNIKNKIAIINGWLISGTNVYTITARYTKTTDSANSYNYANENDYSTSEKIIGKWIDGSNLYQRTFTGTTSSSTDSVTVATISGAKIKRMFGVISTTGTDIASSTTQVLIPVAAMKSAGFSDDVNIFSYADNGTVVLFYGSGLNTYRNRGYSLTIQYTK